MSNMSDFGGGVDSGASTPRGSAEDAEAGGAGTSGGLLAIEDVASRDAAPTFEDSVTPPKGFVIGVGGMLVEAATAEQENPTAARLRRAIVSGFKVRVDAEEAELAAGSELAQVQARSCRLEVQMGQYENAVLKCEGRLNDLKRKLAGPSINAVMRDLAVETVAALDIRS